MRQFFAIAIVLFSSWSDASAQTKKNEAARDHGKAITKFRNLAKGQFPGSITEIETSFNECFQNGDRAAAFGDLFKKRYTA